MGKEAAAEVVPKFKLNDSHSIPALGLGTLAGSDGPDAVRSAVLTALKMGYRHIDTASAYHTEQAIGSALQEAFKTGLVKREDVFVTTKIAPQQLQLDNILPTIKTSLSNLQLDYVDLYLIHQPFRVRADKTIQTMKVDDLLPLDLKATWEMMEKLVELGLTRSIGVSNCHVKKLQEILLHAKVIPAVNQIELHPQCHQTKLRAFCQKKGIHVSAWAPMGAPGTFHGFQAEGVMDNLILKRIAERHGKSVPQISLRWVFEMGASALPKSCKAERQAENFAIWDFSLTEEDHEEIKALKQVNLAAKHPRFRGAPITFEEYWDNDE